MRGAAWRSLTVCESIVTAANEESVSFPVNLESWDKEGIHADLFEEGPLLRLRESGHRGAEQTGA